jgi:hypothetical protein
VFRTEYPASRSNQKPTVFHVTHWKAGSQWVRSVLNAAAPDRLVQGKDSPSWFFKDPIVSGGIYTPVYTTAEAFHQIVPAHTEDKTFVLIRDPRDTAVSWYFSLLYSHPTNYETVSTTRETLQHLNKPEGMTLVFREYVRDVVAIQRSWLQSGAKIFRYEDLLADQEGVFGEIFEHCGIDISPERLHSIVGRFSFRRRTWWRFRKECVKSHLRKGVAGDWKNHFDARLKDCFKTLYGDELICAGYEKNFEW